MRPGPRFPIRRPFSTLPRLHRTFGMTIEASLALWAGVEISAPQTGNACPVLFDLEDSISLEVAPGRNAEVSIGGMTREDEGPTCAAWVSVPLSAFPSTRLATRPADVARSLRDAVEKMGATECTITVMHDNDTGEVLAEHELCLNETFRFGERRVWSSGPETFCWEPGIEVETDSTIDADEGPFASTE